MTDKVENQTCKTPWKDLRRGALEEYEKASVAAHSWSSVIPRAIDYYFDHCEFPPVESLPSEQAGEGELNRASKSYKEHLRESLKTFDDYVGYLSACHDDGPETFQLAVKDVMEFTRASQPQAERDAVFRQAIAIARNPHLKNSLWSKEQDKAAGQVQERIAVALEYARRGQNYRNSLSQPQATGEVKLLADKLEEMRACEGAMCGHCIELLCDEILPLVETLAAHPVEQGEDDK